MSFLQAYNRIEDVLGLVELFLDVLVDSEALVRDWLFYVSRKLATHTRPI